MKPNQNKSVFMLGTKAFVPAVAVLMLSACGKESGNSSKSSSSPTVATAQAPSTEHKVLMTCTLKQDSDDLFYVYENPNKQLYIAKINDPKASPETYDLLGKKVNFFTPSKKGFIDGVSAAAAKTSNGEDTGYLAVVINKTAKTVEVVRYQAKTARLLNGGAIPTSEITNESRVLFASGTCEEGKPGDDAQKGLLQKAKETLQKAGTSAQKGADNLINNIQEAVEGKPAPAPSNPPVPAPEAKNQAEKALDKVEGGVKEAAKDIKEEAAELLDRPAPSKEAVDVIRILIEDK